MEKNTPIKTVAIGYITENGTTLKAAERISKRLSEKGFDARVIRLSDLNNPLEFDFLIFGSPIIGLRSLPQFQLYLEEHLPELSNVLGIFGISYIHRKAARFWTRSIEKHFKRQASIAMAQSCRIFGKTLDKTSAGVAKLIFGLPQSVEPDQFHPEEVDSWADELIEIAQRG